MQSGHKGGVTMKKRMVIKNINARWISLVVVGLVLSGLTGAPFADTVKIDTNALIHETQKMSDKPNTSTMVWWAPEEFWEHSFSQNPGATEAQVEEMVAVIRPYTIIIVVDGTIGPFGGVTFKSEPEIRPIIQVRDGRGNIHRPLGEESINVDTRNFLSAVRPVFANMMGPLGENMHFFLFPSHNSAGEKIADATKEGSFSLKLGAEEFAWRLPLGSLLPPKICPTCGAKLSGAYKFCPWDGTKLE